MIVTYYNPARQWRCREPDKNGGSVHQSARDAMRARDEWFRNTGVRCEIEFQNSEETWTRSTATDLEVD